MALKLSSISHWSFIIKFILDHLTFNELVTFCSDGFCLQAHGFFELQSHITLLRKLCTFFNELINCYQLEFYI